MTNGADRKKKLYDRLRIALAVLAVLVLALVVPPLISVSHYKGQITHLIAQSLGRPVRLSSVQVVDDDDGGEELIEKLVHINRVSRPAKGGGVSALQRSSWSAMARVGSVSATAKPAKCPRPSPRRPLLPRRR